MIEVQSLTRHYGRTAAVQDVSFNIGNHEIVGLLGYGTRLVLFVHALRHLGAGRTAAYFSTAPFIGAVVAVVALDELLGRQLALGAGLMAFGVWLAGR